MAARNRKTSMSKPCYIPSTPHEVESGAGAGSSQSSHGVGGQVGEANDGDSIPHTRNGILNTGSSAVGIDVMATQPSSSGLVRDVIGIFVVAFDTKEGNLLEWCIPQELPLEGVEFRALISGATYYHIRLHAKSLDVTQLVEKEVSVNVSPALQSAI
ncbi:uncharacterized protein LOC119578508 [Penaeus monodon]|uniref:uncharacterized protein LOC119578508 n=1 Tax=Penaeus monodon TaxID=6687 RepID=UPI0018A74B76|nr:uncharacterized protein LOC119578508 [Penaeus monodon]